jgi:SAM-dependent methyltransferase
MDSKEYWEKQIINWERSSYQGNAKDLSIVERIAAKFRGPIRKRKELLLDILSKHIDSSTILELGCGSGGLCLDLLRRGARRVIGIDISAEAIKLAKENAEKYGLKEKAEFLVVDLREDIKLPDVDFVVGLGFIDYIDIDTLKKLLSKIRGKFIFSFPEKKLSLINILHYIYMNVKRCPSFYKFYRREFDNIPGMFGKCHFYELDDMIFITNYNIGDS